MSYLAIKHIHMLCAGISISLFITRGIWMLTDSPMLTRRWVKIAPHINDTLLLTAAITLAVWSHQYPFVMPWLTAKVLALLAYIGLGMVALKRGRSKPVRAGAFALALLTFAYIVAVALTRSPTPGW
ncbi:SirB2 family protein [Chitinivorax sp. PXF-14]|uniref:SirB2 family protein n=1 Tax=Chitinivorax sp. PXF-14 TaxID=3230488 RepID=UPI003465378C